MRQTGITAGNAVSEPTSVARGIELDETLFVERPLAEAGTDRSPPTLVPHRDSPQVYLPAPRSVAAQLQTREIPAPAVLPDATAPLVPSEIVVEIPASSRTETREYASEAEKRTQELVAPTEVMPPPRPHFVAATEPQLESGFAAVRVEKPEISQQAPEKKLPTLADVRAWVARPLLQTAEPSATEPPSRPPAVTRVVGPSTPTTDHRENYSLEIGTIQILIDGPAAPAPQRPAPPDPPSEPAKPSWGRASRHYLRA
jgi:hypothetical protein